MRERGEEPRSARTARTREEIVAAARRLLREQGYRPTSLRDVAAAAGISPAGLRRHVAAKEELLTLVLDQVEAEERSGGARPDHAALLVPLLGEAAAAEHPAHARMRARRERRLRERRRALEDARVRGELPPDRDPASEALRQLALEDGLRLMALYLPDRIDVSTLLARAAAEASGPRRAVPARLAEPPPSPAPTGRAAPLPQGYRTGRARRAQILAAATALFGEGGFGDTGVQEIAERSGASKSLVLHHFGSKDALLLAVLAERDRVLREHAGLEGEASEGTGTLESLARAVHEARLATAREPGLVRLYAVLSSEAAPAGHPAHGVLAERFTQVVGTTRAVLERGRADGTLREDVAAEQEALLLTALWDGLQLHWLYDGEVDVAGGLAAHLAQLLAS